MKCQACVLLLLVLLTVMVVTCVRALDWLVLCMCCAECGDGQLDAECKACDALASTSSCVVCIDGSWWAFQDAGIVRPLDAGMWSACLLFVKNPARLAPQ
jgi:hypothetical protein